MCIIYNTYLLSCDQYPITREQMSRNEFLNETMSWIFFSEMMIKILGLGFKEYAADNFNVFDCSVVMVSLIEYIIE